ncbi:exodeoxyribonuclease V subunit gamma [Shigella flexneri]
MIQSLESATTGPPGLPSRVFICGISALPPVYPQALQAPGKQIELYLLFTNPCRYHRRLKDPAIWRKLGPVSVDTVLKIANCRDLVIAKCREPFNSDGEQDVGNPLRLHGEVGADDIISF